MRRQKRLLLAALLLLPLVAGAASLAQEAPAAQPEKSSAAPPPAERASPQATVRTFFGAFRAVRQEGSTEALQDAIDTLDLSAIAPTAREVKGQELVVQLKDVLDRTERIDVDALPTSPATSRWVLITRPEGDVALARQPDGQWLFSTGTVERIPALAQGVTGEAVVEGVVEAPRSLSPAVWVRSKVPASLHRVIFLLEGWQWLGLVLMALVGMVVDKIVTALAAAAWAAFFRRHTPQDMDSKLAASTARPLGVVAAALAWSLAVPWLGLPAQPLGILTFVITFLIAAGMVWALYRAVDVVGALLEARAARTESKFDDLLVPLVRKSLKVFIAAFGLVFVAENMDLDVTGLVAGLGIGGLALALAAQDAVKNLFGSVMVILDRPFAVGDVIRVDDLEGVVEELGFRSTRIRTFYDSLVTLPNARLIDAAVDNLGRRAVRRWKTTLALTYDTPPERVEAFCEGVRELIRQHPLTVKDTFRVYFNEFGAASLDVLLQVFFETTDFGTELGARHRLGVDILRLAERLEVDFAFPTQTIHLLQGGGERLVSAPEGYGDRIVTAGEAARGEARALRFEPPAEG